MSPASSLPTAPTEQSEDQDTIAARVRRPAASSRTSLFDRVPWLSARTLLFAVVIVIGLFYAYTEDSYTLFLADTVLVYAIAAIGQEWLIGRAGQVSIGGGALIWIGAFTVAKTNGTVWSNFPIPLILCAVVGAVVGLVIGLPALRLRGVYLLLITLALNFVAQFAGYESQKNSASGIHRAADPVRILHHRRPGPDLPDHPGDHAVHRGRARQRVPGRAGTGVDGDPGRRDRCGHDGHPDRPLEADRVRRQLGDHRGGRWPADVHRRDRSRTSPSPSGWRSTCW